MRHALPVVSGERADQPTSNRLGFSVLDAEPQPPWPHRPCVEWQVCGGCNYDCSYCIQSKKYRVGYPSSAELDRMLAFLFELSGSWEIKMTGGEPFSSKLFLSQIIPALMKTEHHISLLTNLSVSAQHLQRFAEMTYGRLSVLSASLHLEFTTVSSFLKRLVSFRSSADLQTQIVVNCVLAPQHLDEIAQARHMVEDAGFRFYPQLMKVKQGVFAYSAEQRSQIESILGGDFAWATQERSANMAPAYTGKLCYTGARYFVLTQQGDLWSCRSAKRLHEGYLGNVHDETARLLSGPHRCHYTICPCSVPANRGMIEGVSMRGATPRGGVKDDGGASA